MSLSPEIQQQRYAAIELAYSERRWEEVESLSQELLQELPGDPADPLRLRLVLLLGHTRLYGMGDAAAAREHYTSVRDHGNEPTLLEIAKQGLEQCQQLEQPAATAPTAAAPWLTGSAQETAPGAGASGASTGTDAAPWLTPAATAQPAPEPAPAPAPAAQEAPAAVEAPAAIEAPAAVPAPERGIDIGPADQEPTGTVEPDATPAADPLVAEIVEEPEQIAVALADPQRRQEVALDVLEEQAQARPALAATPQDPLHFDADALSPEELQELSRGLLRLSAR